MRRLARRVVAPLALAAAVAGPGGPTPLGGQQVSVDRLEAIRARNIGPAGMSGRVTSVDVVRSDPSVIFVGSATGGVFRSTDGGVTWDPVFDDQPVLGIGSVAVFQPNPDIVWVGTGEGNPRNSAGVGNGIYRSLDGGETWTLMGLAGSERIHRVLTHPADPDIVYAGVMGPAWSDGEVRGVYRTLDGGETWERVLYVDEGTGVADLVMDPSNPDHLLAALWDFRRDPWFFRSGGPGSGLHVTYDGGDTWVERTSADGLPEGELGRIGLAFAPSDPEVVYALVEATRSELLRSDDGGRSFRTVNDEPGIASRPFYYADLRVDPENENRLYSLFSAIQVSEDAGRTFRTVVPSAIIHGDVHELWIDPSDSRHMIIGNDGGIGITWDRGDNWRFVENLTLAQYYHVSVDDAVPFNVYGGLQDNGSWFGPSDVWENKGILNAHFTRVGGGDGFWVLPDPSDERYGYAASQGGALTRFDKLTGARTSIQPLHPEGEELRFNWNAAVATDPHDPEVLYIGSQYVHRSYDQGASWEIISPDLTTDDPAKQVKETGGLSQDATGAETHTTILDISPSPLEPGVLWVSTDDGKVQLTRDGGASWSDLTDRVPDVPSGTWAPDVDPSFHDPARAYLVFEDHRRGNWEPYLYRTGDYGRSWERMSNRGIEGFIHAVAEDPVEPNLLFVGTEFGLFVSLDGGGAWQRWAGVPAVPVRDLLVHPRDGDLVLGTHGRGAWVVDDIRPLRALASRGGVAPGELTVFDPPPAIRHEVAEAIGYRSTGMAMWQGETRPYGALVSFWVPEGGGGVGARGEAAPDGPSGRARADIRVSDDQGRAVRTARVAVEPGLNRWVWDLRGGGDVDEGAFAADGVEVFPADYTVSVSFGDARAQAPLLVEDDPRIQGRSVAQYRERVLTVQEVQAMAETADAAEERLEGLVDALERIGNRAGSSELRSRAGELAGALTALQRQLFTGPECQGICAGEPVRAPIRSALFRLRGGRGFVTPNERLHLERASTALDQLLGELNGALAGPVADFRDALEAVGYTPLPDLSPVVRRP